MGMSVSLLGLMSRLVLEWLINTSLPHAVTHPQVSMCSD